MRKSRCHAHDECHSSIRSGASGSSAQDRPRLADIAIKRLQLFGQNGCREDLDALQQVVLRDHLEVYQGSAMRLQVNIIGAGIGGLCLAHGLLRADINVAVYEKGPRHKLWREANGGAQCGKSARCVRRGGGSRRGVGRDLRATPARQPSTLPMRPSTR